jgi:GxxExxY protein
MNTNGREWVEGELTHRVVGCAMAVLNELGHGLREKTYERAMCVELRHRVLPYQQQQVYPIHYRGEHIDDYIPDLQVDGRMIVEVKTVDRIIDEHIGQVLNYLRISGLEAGLILNFKRPKLEWRKVVLQGKEPPE